MTEFPSQGGSRPESGAATTRTEKLLGRSFETRDKAFQHEAAGQYGKAAGYALKASLQFGAASVMSAFAGSRAVTEGQPHREYGPESGAVTGRSEEWMQRALASRDQAVQDEAAGQYGKATGHMIKGVSQMLAADVMLLFEPPRHRPARKP
jgi:hypothetical protein